MADTVSEFYPSAVSFGRRAAEKPVGPQGALTTRLQADLAAAVKSGDGQAKSALRVVVAALQNAEVAGAAVQALGGPEEIAIVKGEVESRRAAAKLYAAGRPEAAARETAEADFLARYLL
ncbi:MAG: GatB/YqeY domain-containing protein [Propionibacteriaceae bacterium]|jgi:uncharacterized protein YqeY|nr:GatB/YqeY domain-containing protein [Propionibacteriaceae bacterium]